VAHCDWLRYKLEPDSHGLTRRCVTTLEHRLPDPRDRLRAIAQWNRQVDRNSVRRAADWDATVRQLRTRRNGG
jgi:hypothetical protein